MGSESDSGVVVVGGGVVGLTTAVVLAERGVRVRLWTRDPVEGTTSAVAGALWWPYRVDPPESARAWALRSLEVYEELALRPETTGVRMVEGVLGETPMDEVGSWAAARLPGLRPVTEAEYPGGWGLWARLPLLDMAAHLPYLRERLTAAGGAVETRAVSDLAEADAPVVVNCTGLAARELVPDPSVRPVRGQLVLVENPGVRTWMVTTGADGSMAYFFPQPGRLVLGGTAEEDVWSDRPDPAVAEAIVRRCAALRPEIADARVLEHRVGLRPARDAVRLERTRLPDGRVLVHNYGHGGAGVTVAWGCARRAAELATE
ncbi:FAD-binding oxidoreductase [Streptomyces sp. Vc74B-19]|uniref:FAD-dependent oxidoreductase n=1 Tax=unclassified Streptomyces TaxID=2593676 RepID=UPI001BFCD2D6|nr:MULTISPECIES: FAD-dependent oxidoreductase [unclassified Streptomyces]MBT3164122.1 FAD-binding oxidoreductase [Streptomyces sp. Vc74B-19]MCO4700169.1 FAD-binding oxidoreductase [Streptomyces sp. RO-S4]MDU0300056.1 FAD-dependent oxidoreductase [Streptomyces sp. PAL114]